MIRNYPGFSQGVSGARLARETWEQAWTLGTTFLFMRRVQSLSSEDGHAGYCFPTAAFSPRAPWSSPPAPPTGGWVSPAWRPSRAGCTCRESHPWL
jgi:hypothetical protein